MSASTELTFRIRDLNLFYGEFQALHDISVDIKKNSITAIIGPSGCGKSTFLHVMNRLVDEIDGVRVTGLVDYNGVDIYTGYDVIDLRKRIGMVFQKPNPFPMSVYDNIAHGPRVHGEKNRRILDETVEKSLNRVALWDEVKDRLDGNALSLSGGQQQRLCIARAIATEPDVILMDEPTSALDPISTAKIEDLVEQFTSEYTIVIVTHNLQQAGRIAHDTAFFLNGKLVEYGDTAEIFFNPKHNRTEEYISGMYG